MPYIRPSVWSRTDAGKGFITTHCAVLHVGKLTSDRSRHVGVSGRQKLRRERKDGSQKLPSVLY